MLGAVPTGQGFFEHFSAGFGEGEFALAGVLAAGDFDDAGFLEEGDVAGEGGAVEGQVGCQLVDGDRLGEADADEEVELGGFDAGAGEAAVVEAGEGAGCLAGFLAETGGGDLL